MISATEQTAATALQDDISNMKNRTIMVIRNQSRSETLESEPDLLTVIDSHARAVGYYEDSLNKMKHRSACYQEAKKIRNEGDDKGCNATVKTTSANGNRAFNTGCKVLEVAKKSARQAVRKATSYYVGSSKRRVKQRVREEVKGKSLTGTKVRSVENAEILRILQHQEVVTTVEKPFEALRRNILGWQHLKPDYAFRGSVMGYDLEYWIALE
jgi:predicted house-cleaning noncanonical NTP pyrophosphatase (MazG superfamily)